ncbi:alpha/beta fold hydrolase [Avibacterium sp. 21-586]|uniref:carboxylesterase family protein n=1 Tax=Avibacterium sp. 21-586 TaxID=2911534 RepID=UPI002245EA51|nr:prolyl oligopeptidase family serine peptidase [Avibacterium sp. 21-586]MCW9710649.1 alpha/beta fold hydrolase [Avibacterium sp. 21-586]
MNNIGKLQPIAEIREFGLQLVRFELNILGDLSTIYLGLISLFIKSKNSHNKWQKISISHYTQHSEKHYTLHIDLSTFDTSLKLLYFNQNSFRQQFCYPHFKYHIKDRSIQKIEILPIRYITELNVSKHIYQTLRYSLHRPKKQKSNHPLIICLHGAGEGGNNHSQLFADRMVETFCHNEQQKKFDYPYVLAPQCPSFWVDRFKLNGRVYRGKQNYTPTLHQLIKHVIQRYHDIDPNRIYIIGASMGGYQALALLTYDPNLFTAGIIACPAKLPYKREWHKLTNIPLWFIHSYADQVVPVANTEKIIQYLQQHQATLQQATYCDRVEINHNEINPHAIFLLIYENKIVSKNISIFQWLSKQTKGENNGYK